MTSHTPKHYKRGAVTESDTPDTAFVGATLIDGTGSPPLPDSAVMVRDGRITWVGRAAELDCEARHRLVDAKGTYAIPGLLDANVHLVCDIEPDVLLGYDAGRYDDLVLESAQVALRAGITTVFDTWGPLESLRRVRDRINAGADVGSRIFFAGNIIGNDGPWSGDFIPKFGESLPRDVVDSVNAHWEQGVGAHLTWMPSDDVRDVVREYIATSGIDFVKYSSSAHASMRFIAFSPDTQAGIVEEAHRAGMTAQACALTSEALKLAIAAGVDLLQHGSSTGLYSMPCDILDMIVSRSLPCVALLNTERRIAAIREEIEALRDCNSSIAFYETKLVQDDNNRRLIKEGAQLLLATDGGVIRSSAIANPLFQPFFGGPDVPMLLGTSHLYWLRAAIEREMDPMNALLAATRNIARAYSRDDEVGTIAPGKRADIVFLDASPLDSPENYTRISYVVKDGEIVDRERLPERRVLTAIDGP